jgi:hypothetical protein
MRNNNSCIAYSKTDRDAGLRLAFLNLRIIEDGAPNLRLFRRIFVLSDQPTSECFPLESRQGRELISAQP